MPYFVIEQIAASLNEQRKSIKSSEDSGAGVAYKPTSDDLRESPSLTILELLREKGCQRRLQRPLFQRSAMDATTT